MGLFGANLEAANLSLTDDLLGRLVASGAIEVTMDAQADDPVSTLAVTNRSDIRFVHAVEIGTARITG